MRRWGSERHHWSRAAWLAVALIAASCASAPAADLQPTLPPWTEGELDIHHINTGRGNAAFVIFPDATTMLVDAGDLNGFSFAQRAAPLRMLPPRPSAEVTAGDAIADYIAGVMPETRAPRIDYAVITHFDSDHYGEIRPGLARSADGAIVLTGVTEVAARTPIGVLLDRGYPDYDQPTDVAIIRGASFENYRTFVAQAGVAPGAPERVERFRLGDPPQIAPVVAPERYPDFSVLNVKVNGEIWSERDGAARTLFDPAVMLDENGRYAENPLSLALTVRYGDFDYFTGGDMTGLSGPGTPDWFDVETPVADEVGEVDVLTLDHHGNRDATNAHFLSKLTPRVAVQQTWTTDHPGGEVVHRIANQAIWDGPREIFSTSMAEETKVAIGKVMTETYASFDGHVVIRVEPGGARYRVYVLDDRDETRRITAVYGPYDAR